MRYNGPTRRKTENKVWTLPKSNLAQVSTTVHEMDQNITHKVFMQSSDQKYPCSSMCIIYLFITFFVHFLKMHKGSIKSVEL